MIKENIESFEKPQKLSKLSKKEFERKQRNRSYSKSSIKINMRRIQRFSLIKLSLVGKSLSGEFRFMVTQASKFSISGLSRGIKPHFLIMDNSFDWSSFWRIIHHGNSGQKFIPITRIHDNLSKLKKYYYFNGFNNKENKP
ncbi:hypothetical protein HYV50_01940 [Candidatus Pacearchaeota archaeon]|nr:hypothetical protein [Candidatus Pacearchaeota archaeon]